MTDHPEIGQLPVASQAFIHRWWQGRARGLFKGEAQVKIGLISRELFKQSDRGAGIIGAAILEDRLRETLHGRLVKGFKRSSFPVRELGALIHACHGLGIIGPTTANDLVHIKAVRNAFAHRSDPIDFSDADVANECRQLELARLAYFGEKDYSGNWTTLGPREPRRQYLNAVTLILEGLILQQQADELRAEPETFLL